MKRTVLIVLGCFLLFACSNNAEKIDDNAFTGVNRADLKELTAKENERVRDDNGFAFNVFREVSKQEGSNVFFSPLSFSMVLGMLYNGADGVTRSEIAEALDMAGFSEEEINQCYQKILLYLLNIDKKTQIDIANSIWYRNGLPVKSDFIEIGKEYFDAKVQALDFNNSASVQTINNWCAKKTNNRIKGIIDGEIPNDAMMYLINAVYFKSQWHEDATFDTDDTKPEVFTKSDKQKITVNMMSQENEMNYYEDENLQSVELDYGSRDFSMVFILPAENTDINQFIESFDNEKLQNAISNSHSKEVLLKLPRFKVENDFSLKQAAENLGMEQMFIGGFNNISDEELFVSNILQKTFVEVNEKGTEAAAVTGAIMYATSAYSEQAQFFADRPFLYLIKEKNTGVILFIGRMDEPKE